MIRAQSTLSVYSRFNMFYNNRCLPIWPDNNAAVFLSNIALQSSYLDVWILLKSTSYVPFFSQIPT